MPFNIEFLKSAFSVDNVIFGFEEDKLKILLIRRADEPYKGEWALPGELVFPDEDLDVAPIRVLEELTGVKDVYLEQVSTFGKVDRHPLGRVITVAYYSLINIHRVEPVASSSASEVQWFNVFEIESLPFDHMEIMQDCLKRLQRNVRYAPIGFELLPETFTLSDVQAMYEAILNKKLDKRNFRKKFLMMDLLEDTGQYQQGVAHRPAKIYKFNLEKYEDFKAKGFVFEM